MKKAIITSITIISMFLLCSCENYSNGEKTGTIGSFTESGKVIKTWEGHLNITQTGMTSSNAGFDFSIDNDENDVKKQLLVAQLDSATKLGWKINLKFHQVQFKNWFSNRGHTDFFVTEVVVLDRGMSSIFEQKTNGQNQANLGQNQAKPSGRTIDTIYVVIYRPLPVSVPTITERFPATK